MAVALIAKLRYWKRTDNSHAFLTTIYSMNKSLFIPVIAVLLILGCSKSPAPTKPANTTDLGKVELVPQVPTQFSLGLGPGQGCILTGKQLADGISVKVLVLSTNANGSVYHSQGEIITAPGRQCAIGMGDIMVEMTPTLKAP